MSAGPRIPLARALLAAEMLTRLWAGGNRELILVGSARRERDEVGDLEFVAPRPPGGFKTTTDPLFDAIADTMPGTGLFAPRMRRPIGEIGKGFARGFASCSLTIRLAGSQDGMYGPINLPVQVNRYEPCSRGWKILMCTGPTEFGRWFLGKWKGRFHIPHTKPASIEGKLVDAYGNVVPVEDEDACFMKLGMAPIDPRHRDHHARLHYRGPAVTSDAGAET